MNNIKVSVIVPVYNVKRYLSECLNSVLDQTLKEIEIICVDDGSTDGCSSILDAYAAEYSHIRVIHKKNSGYGNTMNMGIDEAKGEYIGFVESDDVILPEFYAHLYEIASRENLDLVKSEAVFWWSKFDYKYHLHYKNMEEYFNKVLIDEDRIKMYGFFMNTWSGIYKRSFLLDFTIRHNETPGASYQDNGFWFLTMSFCRRGMWLSESFYKYRQDNPEASVKNVNKVMAMSKEYEYIYDELKRRSVTDKILDMCNYYRLMRNHGNYYRIADEFKLRFVDTLRNDYDKYGEVLNDNKVVKQWYIDICSEPKEFTSNIVERKKIIINKINNCDKIYIYGAGNIGKALYRKLCFIGYSEKIAGFIVTNKSLESVVCGRPVYSVDDIQSRISNSLIIVSVVKNSKFYMEIIDEINNREITNFIDFEDLIKLFYSLV